MTSCPKDVIPMNETPAAVNLDIYYFQSTRAVEDIIMKR